MPLGQTEEHWSSPLRIVGLGVEGRVPLGAMVPTRLAHHRLVHCVAQRLAQRVSKHLLIATGIAAGVEVQCSAWVPISLGRLPKRPMPGDQHLYADQSVGYRMRDDRIA